MQELNLEVGQKVWSIQLGDCKISEKTGSFYICVGDKNMNHTYYKDGTNKPTDFHQSLFESNPFEKISVSRNIFKSMDDYYNSQSTLETVSQPENKAELINALFNIGSVKWDTHTELAKIANEKLIKLLESL